MLGISRNQMRFLKISRLLEFLEILEISGNSEDF